MPEKKAKRGMSPWLVVLIALLDDVAVLVILFAVLWGFNIRLPIPVIIVLVVVLGALIFIIHRAVVPSLRRKKTTGAEGMIGMTAEVSQALSPKGTVLFKGEYWRASSAEGDIDEGAEVEITGVRGLELDVKRKTAE